MIYFYVFLIVRVYFNRVIECSVKEMVYLLLCSNIKLMVVSYIGFFNFYRIWYAVFGLVDNLIVNSDLLLIILGNRISNF